MRLFLLSLLIASALAACVSDPDDLGTDESALLFTAPNPTGNLSLVTRPPLPDNFATVNTGGASTWRTIDRMSAVAWTKAGDDLEVEVAAFVTAAGNLWVRVLVDGAVAAPSDVLFKSGGAAGVRSFRFVKNNMTAGSHVIEVQWLGDPNARFVDNTLTVHSAAPAADIGRLVAVSPPSGPTLTHSSTSWATIPGMVATVNTATTRDLAITFSGETRSIAGGFFVRALVDGVVASDTQLMWQGVGGTWGARSHTFLKFSVPAGTHTVAIQWATSSNGAIQIGDRSLTVASNAYGTIGGGAAYVGSQNTTTSVGTSWTLVSQVGLPIWDASAIAAIHFSGELASSSSMSFRAVVDGVVARPGDVVLVSDNAQWASHGFTFHAKNLGLGFRNVRIEARVSSGTGYVRDRALAATYTRREGADFAQPTEGMRPRHGEYKHVVICFDPHKTANPDGGAFTPARKFSWWELYFIYIGDDGRKNVTDWFAEQSRRKFVAGRHWFLGTGTSGPPYTQGDCYDTNRPDNWYWQDPAANEQSRFLTMHQDALNRAAQDLDFLQFDTNGDRILTVDEVLITVVKPQAGQAGFWRHGLTFTTPGGITLRTSYIDAYLEPTGTRASDPRVANVGLAAHEMSHALLGAQELAINLAYDAFTTMDNYGLAGHLDPVHKLFSGWIVPDVIEVSELAGSSASVPLRAIEVGGEAVLIYDRTRSEALLVENRWPDRTNYDSYDLGVTATPSLLGNGGVVVWHLIYDRNWGAWDPDLRPHLCAISNWMVPCPSNPRPPATLSTAGEWADAFWMDGTPAVRISNATNAPATEMQITIARP